MVGLGNKFGDSASAAHKIPLCDVAIRRRVLPTNRCLSVNALQCIITIY